MTSRSSETQEIICGVFFKAISKTKNYFKPIPQTHNNDNM